MKALSGKQQSKILAPSARDINEAHRLARTSAETAVEHAIRCGQMLIERKGAHGEFEAWVEKHCDFSVRSARAYMQAAKAAGQNGSALPFSSLRKALESSASAKSKAPKSPSEPHTNSAAPGPTATPARESAPAGKARPTYTDNQLKTIAVEHEEVMFQESTGNPSAPQTHPENQAGVTIESAGASHAVSAQSDASLVGSVEDPEWAPDPDEDERLARFEREYNESIAKVMGADGKLAAAHVEIKRQADEIAVLKVSRDGFMQGKQAIVDLLKKEQRTTSALERKLKKAQETIDALQERVAIMEAA